MPGLRKPAVFLAARCRRSPPLSAAMSTPPALRLIEDGSCSWRAVEVVEILNQNTRKNWEAWLSYSTPIWFINSISQFDIHTYIYNIHHFQERWLGPLPKCAYRWHRLFEFWHLKRAWNPFPLLLWAAPSMPECVANVFQGCAIYAGGKGKGERRKGKEKEKGGREGERERRRGKKKGKGQWKEEGQEKGERERNRELDFSSGNHSSGLRHL